MSKSIIKIKHHSFSEYISQELIIERIAIIARDIKNYYNDREIIAICLLKGAFFVFSELMKNLSTNVNIEFIRIHSYKGMQQNSRIVIQKQLLDIKDKHILIIEDIVDSGRSITNFKKYLKKNNPNSIKIFTLLYKEKSQINVVN